MDIDLRGSNGRAFVRKAEGPRFESWSRNQGPKFLTDFISRARLENGGSVIIDDVSCSETTFGVFYSGQYCIECCALLLEAECYCESLNWINSFISVVTGFKRSVGKFGLEVS
ncbi:hypothetical protein HZH66_013878 [Vespula vulgaris]|uniref:Uncharacterized protein n=1 Tax=Vespula vulgaris TaxID=7454 RepID=A0A834MRZ5_VESVU|nr:hypothetical protein HZH66_013878 [Vespula vulgaris]